MQGFIIFFFNLYYKPTDTKSNVYKTVRILILKSNLLERGKDYFLVLYTTAKSLISYSHIEVENKRGEMILSCSFHHREDITVFSATRGYNTLCIISEHHMRASDLSKHVSCLD